MSDLKLGELITDPQNRDATHIAVCPVVAYRQLSPGQHIGFVEEGNSELVSLVNDERKIGIVDPFLTTKVKVGERFWMFLYPNTITSLRHDWTHPAFQDVPKPKSPSQRWIEDFADGVGLSYNELMDGAANYIEYGQYLCRDGLLEGEWVPPEFWDHYAEVTGVKNHDGGNFFTCSC